MDPMSITVSCLTLLGVVAKTSLAVTSFIRGCRSARSDLTAISGELIQLQLVLDLLKDDTDLTDDRVIPESLQAQILSIIANCSVVVDTIDKVLRKNAGKAGPAKWTTNGKTEVDALRMSLEAHRGSLSLVLELVSVSLSKSIKEDTSATRNDVHDIKQDTSQIPHILAELDRLRAIAAKGNSQSTTQNQNHELEQSLDSVMSYAETVCGVEIDDSDKGTRLEHQAPGPSIQEKGWETWELERPRPQGCYGDESTGTKLVVLGDRGVGKTTLIRSFCWDTSASQVHFSDRSFQIFEASDILDAELSLGIYDRPKIAFVVTYAVDWPESLTNAADVWVAGLRLVWPWAPVVLVGLKGDLPMPYGSTGGPELASEIGAAGFCEIFAKRDDSGVLGAFESAAEVAFREPNGEEEWRIAEFRIRAWSEICQNQVTLQSLLDRARY
ncbi:hypothetical protein QBC39DRAFT_86377 [Podospora conica]|nr:hypothetical protein QBC39DRAFT_86377 [Schizothecium conicum]